MHPYTPNDLKGRFRARDDIHHRTADIPRAGSKLTAKVARHGARRQAKADIVRELQSCDRQSNTSSD